LFPLKPDRQGLILTLSRAKDGAISPRLANRYSRFALSHRSCDDGFNTPWEWEQRVERSQVADPPTITNWRELLTTSAEM
jgi:hypothetical protein